MALSRDKKEAVVDDLAELLSSSKLTVVAKYQGTPVKSMQQLRNMAKSEGTKVRVAKNRLFKRALEANPNFSSAESDFLRGQLLYAFNAEDEVAPARVLADFAKTNPQIEFVAGLTIEGQLLDGAALSVLASLPTKQVLRAQLIGAISSPVSGFMNVLSGNLRGLINVFNAHAKSLS